MSDQEIQQGVRDLIENRRVVEFRGFRGLLELTQLKKDLILSELSRWAEQETLVYGWLKGLQGSSSADPEELEKSMDALYHEVEEQGRIVYQMQQIPGPPAHAWLVIGMDPTQDPYTGNLNGYLIHFIDPKQPDKIMTIPYLKGQVTFRHYRLDVNFVPYTQLDHDFAKIGSAILAKCNPKVYKKRLVRALYLDPRYSSGTIAGWAVFEAMAGIVAQYKKDGTPADIPVIQDEEFDLKSWPNLIGISQ